MINFKYSDLCNMLGQKVPQETLVQRIPMIGADMHDTEPGCEDMGVEFFPDRPDLYSVEGLARALRAFLDIEPGMKRYEIADGDVEVTVDPSVKELRPWFLCGVVRGVDIDDEFLRSMMELQEKLHITIGRKRSKLAIGIHDLNKVEPPFVYKLADPHSVRFVPLAMDEEMDLAEILERNEKGKAYAHLLDGFDRYPVILDRNGSVLSFPPIINGVLTTVTVGKHDLFIDVTGNDRKAVKGALDIVATALAERGGRIETVIMHDGDETFRSPDLTPTKRKFSASACDRFLGTMLGPEGMVECLRRMGMDAVADGDEIDVTIAIKLAQMHQILLKCFGSLPTRLGMGFPVRSNVTNLRLFHPGCLSARQKVKRKFGSRGSDCCQDCQTVFIVTIDVNTRSITSSLGPDEQIPWVYLPGSLITV